MGFADFYFEKQKYFEVKINSRSQNNLKYIVVIPCFNEFNILDTLNSLWKCQRIRPLIEVIVIINSGEDTHSEIIKQNNITYNEVEEWIKLHKNPLLHFFVINVTNLPKKYAGAGLARKIGMDQAAYRFNIINQCKGVIISLDADVKLKINYFEELEKYYGQEPNLNATTIYFEHPIEGNEFSEGIYQAISKYELYMRYYKLALNFAGFPYSYYTIGSCFAVRPDVYVKQGGMNRKQAGEDFYFLHKIFPLGNVKEINTTCVYPSPRPSDRVPFGTGPMVSTISEADCEDFMTYDFNSFLELKTFFSKVDMLFRISSNKLNSFLSEIPNSISDFLINNSILEAISEINQNSSNINTFTKRFFKWFDAFRVLKYLNQSHKEYHIKQPLLKEAELLLSKLSNKKFEIKTHKKYLEIFRSLERQF